MQSTKAILAGRWRRHLTTAVVAMGLLGLAGSAARAADPITDTNVAAAVAAAKTPEDHQALAGFFTSKAEAALASAENHEAMAKAFGPGKGMASHCKDLASAARKQAKDYTALAKAEDALAKGATGHKHK